MAEDSSGKSRKWLWIGGIGAIVVVSICLCLTVAIIASPETSDTSQSDIQAREETEVIVSTDAQIPPTEAPEIPTTIPQPTDTPLPLATETLAPTSTPAPMAPPYNEIRSTVEGMTEAQWKAYLPTLEGNIVANWSGWVEDVDVKLFGDYELWVDMDSPDELFSIQDVTFIIPEDVALELQKDQKVTFSGVIDRASNVLGSVQIDLLDVELQY